MPKIYFLHCPLADAVRYIGKASDPEKRLAFHMREAALSKATYHRLQWLRKLMAVNAVPACRVLFEVPDDQLWQPFERFFIASAKHLGFPLVNFNHWRRRSY